VAASLRSSPPHSPALAALWRGRSVRAQLLLVFVLIDVVAVIVAGSVAIARARMQARVEMTASIRLAEFLVSDAVSLARQALPTEQFLDALPAQLQSIRHVRIQVTDATGTPIVAGLFADKAATRREVARSPAPAWFAALVAPSVQSRDLPVTVDGRTIGRVEITGEPADEIAEVWDNLVAIGAIGILLNAAMIALLYVVFGRVLDPLKVLASGLSELEHRSYNVRLPRPQARELSVITDHFNALAAALATARAENLSLNRRLITAQDDERRRTALELHDEVGPCLFGLKANASSIAGATADLPDKAGRIVSERVQDIRGIVDHLQSINRSMLDRLRPMALGHIPLGELLGQMVHERARRHAVISFSFTATALKASYGDSIDLTIYRCVQESLTNAVRHAEPKHITVELTESDARLDLAVCDDGRGLAENKPAGFGLRGMQERVEGLGGCYRLGSAAGGGTSVNISLPLLEMAERAGGAAHAGDDP
jgi:two-component system, NarL family, sensor histidine kinase UhpB